MTMLRYFLNASLFLKMNACNLHVFPFLLFRGMTVSSGSVKLKKDSQNLIGISIGGGAPYCPCLYVVQIFDNTPAAKDGTLASGDEIVGVNGQPVKAKSKVEVARLIQSYKVSFCFRFFPFFLLFLHSII